MMKISRMCIVALIIAAGGRLLAAEDDKYVNAVQTFADNVLKYGKDTYGPKHTPLFIDGINLRTHEPAKWKKDGQEWILSNLASQQNLFRVLDGLTLLTNDPKYRREAVEATQYAFANLRSPNGLLHWGGHVAYDALADDLCMEQYQHELKCNYPYYELMWQVDPQATRQFLEKFWSAHILDWSNLEMNRHGNMKKQFGNPWANKYEAEPVFFWGTGLSFINTGSDMFYAAAMLSRLSGEAEPLTWSKRMAKRYVETRNPKTGIGGYQFSQSKTASCAPGIQGDRAQYQYGDDFPGHFVVEGTLFPCYGDTPEVRPRICEFLLGEMLGGEGGEFTQWALEELTAWGKVAYREKDNSFVPMLTDGTSMEGYVCKKEGYFGPAGRVLKAGHAGPMDFWTYALAWRITGDAFMWEMARNIARGNAFGDIGASPKDEPQLKMDSDCSDSAALLGFLELHKKTGKPAYLNMARRIGDNILSTRFGEGFFVRTRKDMYVKFDAVEPLVLLHLDCAVKGRSGVVPVVWPSTSYFHCPYDGKGRTYDNSAIYSQKLP
jgi:pectate lyase